MTYLAGAIVRASDLEDVCAAVRAGFGGIGASEGAGGARLDVRVGQPVGGWILITDSTHHTFDLGVAAAVAEALKARVAVFGSRGAGTSGKGVIKSFGTWKTKLPGSLKPSAVYRAVSELARGIWPFPWEVDTRPGITLSFDVAGAHRMLGPFKTNTASELREAAQKEQVDASWHISNGVLNQEYERPFAALGALRDREGWEYAFDGVMHILSSRSATLTADAARLFAALAKPALDGLTLRTFADGWRSGNPNPIYRTIRWGLALLAAGRAGDADLWDDLVARIGDPALVPALGVYMHAFSPRVIDKLPPAMRARLERDFPVEALLQWAAAQPHDPNQRMLDDAAQIAARTGGALAARVLAHAAGEASRDPALAEGIAHEAFRLARAGRFPAALVLFDQVIQLAGLDEAVYCNALWAVQADNNKLPIDAERARRYLAACEPHAEDNVAIYVNAACVRHELGDTAGALAALEAARRHKLVDALAKLRDEPMFAALRGDPRFDAATAPRAKRKAATRQRRKT